MTSYRVIAASALLVALGACTRQEFGPPEVLGIRFGATTESFRQFIPDSGVREDFPLIPAHGYKLSFPNPDNWTVIVQDSSEDLARNQVYGIHLSRMGDDNCTQESADSLMRTIRNRYFAGFEQVVTRPQEGRVGVSTVGLGERRMLAVGVSCFIRTLTADFSYLDLDLFAYRDTLVVDSLLQQVTEALRGYESRTLKH